VFFVLFVAKLIPGAGWKFFLATKSTRNTKREKDKRLEIQG
jgi:hypothetical protein